MNEPLFTIENAVVEHDIRFTTREILWLVWDRLNSSRSRTKLIIHCKELHFIESRNAQFPDPTTKG